MSDGFWQVIDGQLAALRGARCADDVVRILAHEHNPYHTVLGDTEPMADGDAFFAGSGGDGTVREALQAAGWETVEIEASYHWQMRSPNGDLITYVEGDIYRHGHVWGPFEHSRLAGTLHRKCLEPACRVISLDGDDEDEEAADG